MKLKNLPGIWAGKPSSIKDKKVALLCSLEFFGMPEELPAGSNIKILKEHLLDIYS